MTIDARGRAATERLRHATTQTLNVLAMYEEVKPRTASRTRTRTALVIVALLATVSGAFAAARLAATRSVVPPVGAPIVASTPTSTECAQPTGVACLGGTRLRVELPVPVSFSLGSTFQGPYLYRPTGDTRLAGFEVHAQPLGVSILEGAVPAMNTSGVVRDPSAGATAASMATWLAHRPYVRPTKVRRTTLAGHAAYVVEVEYLPGAALHGTKVDHPAAYTFFDPYLPAASFAVSSHLAHARYYLVDLPRAGVTVVWSWVLDGTSEHLAAADRFITTLTFG